MSILVWVNSVNREMEYKDFVSKLFKVDTEDMEKLHAALGICGEAGELADAIKKHVIYGKGLDRENVVEELGDLRFYMEALMNIVGVTDEEVLQYNATKLAKRYPKGEYSNVAAIARLDKVGEDTSSYASQDGEESNPIKSGPSGMSA